MNQFELYDLPQGIDLSDIKDGNAPAFDDSTLDPVKDSPLAGKRILALGSSVTFGSASEELSFCDYLAKKHNLTCVKEAVSGTTLADVGELSYVSRLKAVDANQSFDAFICQLSTNDRGFADKGLSPSGEITGSPSTTYGAIKFITEYVKSTFNCPILFYTNPYFDDGNYRDMVTVLNEMARKSGVFVLDLFNDRKLNQTTKHYFSLLMADAIHPTQAGYRCLWLKKFEDILTQIL